MSASALRILVVDNEPSVTFSLKHIFNGSRYDFNAVENGDAALARLNSSPERYDIIIVDQKMPHMTGAELVGEMRKRGIDSKIMVLSADISIGSPRCLRTHGRARHVPETVRRPRTPLRGRPPRRVSQSATSCRSSRALHIPIGQSFDQFLLLSEDAEQIVLRNIW